MPGIPNIESENGGPIQLPPVDLTLPPAPYTAKAYVRNLGSDDLVNTWVWVDGTDLEVADPATRTFGSEVRTLGDIAPGERAQFLVRRPASNARGRQSATLHVRCVTET
jgi:hypothetical protein